MSGAAVVDFTLMKNSKDVFRQQAEYLNCSINVPSQEVVDCLQTKSAEEILNSSTRFYVSVFNHIKVKYISSLFLLL